MKRFIGTYDEEFEDPEYEGSLRTWLEIVRSMADDFFNASFEEGDVEILPAQISYPPNHLLIDRAVINAHSDIKRIKEYHNIGQVEKIKFAAYIGYWLAKAKPFSLCIYEYNTHPIQKDGKIQTAAFNFCFSINEIFIAEFMLAVVFNNNVSKDRLEACEKCLRLCEKSEFQFVPPLTIIDSLHYYLCYRLRSAQELELFLKGLLACPIGCSHTYREL